MGRTHRQPMFLEGTMDCIIITIINFCDLRVTHSGQTCREPNRTYTKTVVFWRTYPLLIHKAYFHISGNKVECAYLNRPSPLQLTVSVTEAWCWCQLRCLQQCSHRNMFIDCQGFTALSTGIDFYSAYIKHRMIVQSTGQVESKSSLPCARYEGV